MQQVELDPPPVTALEPEIEATLQLDAQAKRKRTESDLKEREVSSSSSLNGGCNESYIVELKDDGKGVFKPQEGESTYIREYREFFKRERAAYIVDKFLNFNLIPPTVIREIDGKLGSVQQFIPDARMGLYAKEYAKKDGYLQMQDDLVRMSIMDYILYNSDRHDRNFMVKERKVIAIDNGCCFGRSEYGMTLQRYILVTEDLDRESVKEIKQQVENLLQNAQQKELMRGFLEELLPKDEVQAFFDRLEIIKDQLETNSRINLSGLPFSK